MTTSDLSNHEYYILLMSKANWRKGPANHIVCEPPHDRPIFSLAVSETKFVTGSADHGLREYNMYGIL